VQEVPSYLDKSETVKFHTWCHTVGVTSLLSVTSMSKRTEPVHTYETMEEKLDIAVNPLESSPCLGTSEEGNLVNDLEESSIQLGFPKHKLIRKQSNQLHP